MESSSLSVPQHGTLGARRVRGVGRRAFFRAQHGRMGGVFFRIRRLFYRLAGRSRVSVAQIKGMCESLMRT